MNSRQRRRLIRSTGADSYLEAQLVRVRAEIKRGGFTWNTRKGATLHGTLACLKLEVSDVESELLARMFGLNYREG